MTIINNNVQNVKFLRNQNVNITRDAAIALLNTHKEDAADGTALLARYTVSGEVKTIVGFVYVTDSTHDITIFDTEGASGNVEKLRREINAKLGNGVGSGASETVTAQLTALSGTTDDASGVTSVNGAKAYADAKISELDVTAITAGEGQFIKSVSQADGKVSATTADMPTVQTVTENGKPIIAVAENKGTIAASAGTINAEFVDVTGNTFTATTVQGALEEIDSEYKAAIESLDYTDTAVTGSYVSKVDEVNGVITVSREALPSVTDAAQAKKFVKSVSESAGEILVERGSIASNAETIVLTDTNDGGVNFEVNIDNDTIVQDGTSKKLKVASAALTQYVGDENTIHITSADSSNNKTVSSLLTIEEVTTSVPNTVSHRFQLAGSDHVKIGEYIDIPKDSALVNFYLGHVDDALTDADPTTQESPTSAVTNGSGDAALVWIMHLANGNYKLTAVNVEAFLEESEFASGVTADSATHIVHGVVDPTSEKDSQDTPVDFLTVGADGFKISGIKDEIDRKINALDATGGTQTIATDKHVAVEVIEANGLITAVTVTEDNIANADDLAELSGKTVTTITSNNGSITAQINNAAGNKSYNIETDASKIKMSGFTSNGALSGITTSSSITEAFGEVESVIEANERVTAEALTDLDGRLDVVEDEYISGVSVNGNAVTVANKIAPILITPATSATTPTSTEAITVQTDTSTGAITLGISQIDCGYYDGTQG